MISALEKRIKSLESEVSFFKSWMKGDTIWKNYVEGLVIEYFGRNIQEELKKLSSNSSPSLDSYLRMSNELSKIRQEIRAGRQDSDIWSCYENEMNPGTPSKKRRRNYGLLNESDEDLFSISSSNKSYSRPVADDNRFYGRSALVEYNNSSTPSPHHATQVDNLFRTDDDLTMNRVESHRLANPTTQSEVTSSGCSEEVDDVVQTIVQKSKSATKKTTTRSPKSLTTADELDKASGKSNLLVPSENNLNSPPQNNNSDSVIDDHENKTKKKLRPGKLERVKAHQEKMLRLYGYRSRKDEMAKKKGDDNSVVDAANINPTALSSNSVSSTNSERTEPFINNTNHEKACSDKSDDYKFTKKTLKKIRKSAAHMLQKQTKGKKYFSSDVKK